MKKLHRFYLLVVASGLLGAGLALADGMDRMEGPMAARVSGQTQGSLHHGEGVVQKVDLIGGKVTIAHGAINSLRWPAMTMGFTVQDRKLLERVVAGERIGFDLLHTAQDQYVITRIMPIQ